VNVAVGTKVTVPSDPTVYVPSFGTVTVVLVHPIPDSPGPQRRTDDESSGLAGEPAESFARGFRTCVAPCSPADVSGEADGFGHTVGVRVDETTNPVASAIRYVTGVFWPAVAVASDTYVTTPVVRSRV
jgi:hypothetical protein